MKHYSIVSHQPVEFGEGVSKELVDIRCDTENDIPEPLPEWEISSSCFIVDTQDVKFLNSQGEWV